MQGGPSNVYQIYQSMLLTKLCCFEAWGLVLLPFAFLRVMLQIAIWTAYFYFIHVSVCKWDLCGQCWRRFGDWLRNSLGHLFFIKLNAFLEFLQKLDLFAWPPVATVGHLVFSRYLQMMVFHVL